MQLYVNGAPETAECDLLIQAAPGFVSTPEAAFTKSCCAVDGPMALASNIHTGTALTSLAAIGKRTGVAKVFGIRFSGFPAWWLWRTVYLLKLPRFEKKLRVAFDWTLDLFFSRDLVQYLTEREEGMSGHPHDVPAAQSVVVADDDQLVEMPPVLAGGGAMQRCGRPLVVSLPSLPRP